MYSGVISKSLRQTKGETVNLNQTPAKLQTYAGIRSADLSVKCDPVNGGGATVDLSSDTLDYDKHTTGYYVAGLMPEIRFPDSSRASVYGNALGQVWAATDGQGLAGFWNENGTIIAEASEWFADRGEAEWTGRLRGERAIWDVAADKAIDL